MKPEKWVAVYTSGYDDWHEAEQVVGIFSSEDEAKEYIYTKYSGHNWNAVRIELPEYDKWA